MVLDQQTLRPYRRRQGQLRIFPSTCFTLVPFTATVGPVIAPLPGADVAEQVAAAVSRRRRLLSQNVKDDMAFANAAAN